MNISILTTKEVLRICHPETELEKRLFAIAEEQAAEILYLEDLPQGQEYDDCDECESKLNGIEDAISLIESGKIDDALKKLQSIT